MEKFEEKDHLVAEDILLYKVDIFRSKTALELANLANAYEFMSRDTCQKLFNDMWYGPLKPYVSFKVENKKSFFINQFF